MAHLVHSTADIIRYLLIGMDLGFLPPTDEDWPIYAEREPDKPDNVITVYNTQGIDRGRLNFTGERVEQKGFQIRLRGVDSVIGFRKMQEIVIHLDEDVLRETIVIQDSVYSIHSINRTSEILSLGKDKPNGSRNLFTVNATCYIRKV